MTDAETGWYLRHRDGVEHGPFRFADIIAAAKLGNIASDTCVRHEAQTLGQWVLAPRVQSIAEVMTKVAPRQVAARTARPSSQASAVTRRASSSNLPAVSASEPAAIAAESDSKVELTPIVRTYREQGYPVPKTFVDACIALFDFRFRSFVTPWIVKILWALSVSCMILWAGKAGLRELHSRRGVGRRRGCRHRCRWRVAVRATG